ncbi:hypothetical protein [Methanorbis rubei]|uniref:Uncharacterized protein n=1 Tax=Methanorbis rubei TaxID=3028300 RepID=A0AAE4MHU6_9EURY|nr:hypothetical protein [Methanocorpusculaceae archaeon Cs1]
MKFLLPFLLFFAVFAAFTAGCLLPPAETIAEKETAFNLSAIERDPVREAAAQAAHFTEIEILEIMQDPEYMDYKQFMNQTDNVTYFDYLVYAYPYGYSKYRNLTLNMSFIEFLERYDIAGYQHSLNHDYQYISFSLDQVSDPDPNLPVINITREDAEKSTVLRAYLLDIPGYSVKVLPSEEWQLDPYWYAGNSRKAYVSWNGTLYHVDRSLI